MLGDMHLGYHNGRHELARWIDLINAEHPDLVLIGGDIIDISVRPLIYEGTEKLKPTIKLKVDDGDIAVLPFIFCLF